MLDKIRIFTKVAEYGSFSQAGKALGLTPSSISRHIDRLESELGIKLFLRSTRHLILTEAGNTLLESARKIIRDEVDLAIRIGNPEDLRLKIRKLITNRTVACASPTYLEHHGAPTHPQDLGEHNCLAINFKRQAIGWHFRRKDEYHRVHVNGNLVSSGGTPLLEAATQDLGVLMLSEWMIREQLQRGELVTILDDWQYSLHEEGSGDVFMVFIDNKYMPPALGVFIDFIVQQFTSKRCNGHPRAECYRTIFAWSLMNI